MASPVSSPGADKTTLLEKTLTLLHPRFRVAAPVGDLVCRTSRDLGERMCIVARGATVAGAS